MATSIDWASGVIHVPKADLTALGGERYQLDMDDWRLELRALEASEAGQVWPETHERSDPYTISGTTYAQGINFVNGYTIEFEDGVYEVRLVGANTNVADVKVVNSVSVIPSNAAGLIRVTSGSGVLPSDVAEIATAARDAILSDSTPFAGARIDAAISSAGGLTAGQAAQLDAVATNADVATSTRAAAGSVGLTEAQATQLAELWRLAALDPSVALTVAAAYRRAGAGIQQTVAEVDGVVTVTRDR